LKPLFLYAPSALIFWGWQMDAVWIAVPLAALLLYSYKTRFKFDFKVSDVNRFVDVSTIFLAGAIVYALTVDAQNAIWFLLRWVPLIFYPIIAVQYFSTAGTIDVQSFFLTARKTAAGYTMETQRIDVTYVYVLLCIISTGSDPDTGAAFFAAAALFSAWGLWQARSRRVHQGVWVMVVVLTLVAGTAGHKAVYLIGRKLNRWMFMQYRGMMGNDPFSSHTSIGDIGQLKLSGTIVMRAAFDEYKKGQTYLLYNGVYSHLYKNNWYAGQQFRPVSPAGGGQGWQINPESHLSHKAKIYSRPTRKKAVLSLPAGTTAISGFDADICQKNAFQVVRFEHPPPLIAADVNFTGQPLHDSAPESKDLSVPKQEAALIASVGNRLALNDKSPGQVIDTVTHYFTKEFSYSLELKGRGAYPTALHNFLLNTRQGHCELFATATVLLLRQAGLPARYVTGFLAHEYSPFEKRVLIRQRDAHAWVRVYIDGRWQELDTTPAGFTALDAQWVSGGAIRDILSYIGFSLSRIRHETGKDFIDQYGLLLIVPLAVILLMRLRKAGQVRKVTDKAGQSRKKPVETEPVSFYLLESVLAQKGYPRQKHETFSSWLKRVRPVLGGQGAHRQLAALLRIHNRIVFGKSRSVSADSQVLYPAIQEWVQRLKTEK
jgi:transglutaminase-like putative cysteine protease